MTVKELFYSNLDRLACRISSVVFLREESLVLFVAARRVWDVVLFSSWRNVVYLYCSLPLDQLGEESLLFFAARRVWNVVPFSQGGKTLFVYHHSTGRLV